MCAFIERELIHCPWTYSVISTITSPSTAMPWLVGQNNRRTQSLRFLKANIKRTLLLSQTGIQKFIYCLEKPKNEQDTCWDVKAVLIGLNRLKQSFTSLHFGQKKSKSSLENMRKILNSFCFLEKIWYSPEVTIYFTYTSFHKQDIKNKI